MNTDQLKGNWKQFVGKAKEKWGKLTDDDWKVAEGKRDQLVGRIQERYGIARRSRTAGLRLRENARENLTGFFPSPPATATISGSAGLALPAIGLGSVADESGR